VVCTTTADMSVSADAQAMLIADDQLSLGQAARIRYLDQFADLTDRKVPKFSYGDRRAHLRMGWQPGADWRSALSLISKANADNRTER
jgi:hypothetical protein